MAQLIVHRGDTVRRFSFIAPTALADVLAQVGLNALHPCGGRGVCGKCAVELRGKVSAPNVQERKLGKRLSCQAVLLGDAEVFLPNNDALEQIETAKQTDITPEAPLPGKYALVADIGTTTLAVQLYRIGSGTLLAEATERNPQTAVAADVMGRISAALHGQQQRLREMILGALETLLRQCCAQAQLAEKDVETLVLTGNTTMLYLLTGRDPTSLSRAPFQADTLFGETAEILGRQALLPPCMNAFVGADITCAVLASRMCDVNRTALLCDIGTNGELALWHNGTLFVTSTAAGPAFEGAGISCGCGSVGGAIDRVWAENGVVRLHTIANAAPIGLCGSGLIDAVAVYLALGQIAPSGAVAPGGLSLCETVRLLPQDIRAVQLAKAAIAAGIDVLLQKAAVAPQEIEAVYIAGGFGSHLHLQSAADIGLLPTEQLGRMRVIGNAALSGAAELLLSGPRRTRAAQIAAYAQHVTLSGDPLFNERYIEHMFLGDEEE